MEAASHLVTQAQRQPGRFGSCYIADAAQAERLRGAAAQTKTKALQAAIAAGIGFHNAAMEPEDRVLVRAPPPVPALRERALLDSKPGDCAGPGWLLADLLACCSRPRPPAGGAAVRGRGAAGAVHHLHAGGGRQPAGAPGGHQGHPQVRRRAAGRQQSALGGPASQPAPLFLPAAAPIRARQPAHPAPHHTPLPAGTWATARSRPQTRPATGSTTGARACRWWGARVVLSLIPRASPSS